MSLSERLRDCEAAPWVIEEIKKLEAENLLLKNILTEVKGNALTITDLIDYTRKEALKK